MARGSSNLTVVNSKHLSRYLAEGEVLYVETRATKLFYFPGPIVVLLIMLVLDYSAAAARYGWAAFPGLSAQFARLPKGDLHYVLYVLGFITLLVLIWLLVRYIRWVRTIYAVSNHRIIIKRGIASRDIDDIPMNQVRGVDVHQTIGQRMLGYGTVRVSAESGQAKSIGNENWLGIPKPFQVQRTIETVMQNPGMASSPYPQQPTGVYSNPPQFQQPPSSPPPK
ncbi:MAG: PH domain-containing protein [Thermoplasmata archaeon]